MKLLNPIDVKNNEESKIASIISKTSDLDKEFNRRRIEIDKINNEFKQTLERQRSLFAKEQENHYKLINSLKNEISILEQKRKEVLVPIEDKWKIIEKAQHILENKEQRFAIMEDSFNNKVDDLQERLTDVAIREQIVDETIENQYKEKEGINRQKEVLSKQTKLFNKLLEESTLDFNKKQEELAKKEAQILISKKNIKEKEKEIKQKEIYFINKERELKDRYATLERSIKRYESSKKRRK